MRGAGMRGQEVCGKREEKCGKVAEIYVRYAAKNRLFYCLTPRPRSLGQRVDYVRKKAGCSLAVL